MDDEYNDLWELDRPVLVTIVTELRAEIEQAKREINARKGTQEATDQALIDEIRKHNRDRRTIRALVVAARVTRLAAVGFAFIAGVGPRRVHGEIRFGIKQAKQAERGQAGKE